MLKLGRAQGVAIAAGLHSGLSVHEYAPKKIKMAIVGKGNASKEQVASMLQYLLQDFHIKEIDTYDASDALAIAYCHYLQRTKIQTSSSYSGWEAFRNKNPDRIIK